LSAVPGAQVQELPDRLLELGDPVVLVLQHLLLDPGAGREGGDLHPRGLAAAAAAATAVAGFVASAAAHPSSSCSSSRSGLGIIHPHHVVKVDAFPSFEGTGEARVHPFFPRLLELLIHTVFKAEESKLGVEDTRRGY
jgi:hypothetical protein